MAKLVSTRHQTYLLGGDIVVLALVTVMGFASHGTASSAGARMLTTFLPLVVAWLLIAPFMGAYDLERVSDLRQIWRPFWAMVVAGPFAAWLRGVLLGTPILPIFVVVLGGFSALAILAWRAIYLWLSSRK